MFDIMQRFLIVVAFRGRLLTPQVPNFHFLDEGVKKSLLYRVVQSKVHFNKK